MKRSVEFRQKQLDELKMGVEMVPLSKNKITQLDSHEELQPFMVCINLK